jgi:cytochrome c556
MNNESASRISVLVFGFVCAVTPLSPRVSAHDGATGIVKERMAAMKEMGDAMKVMGDIVKGKRPFEREAFVEGSRVVAKNSPQIPRLFPEGSGGGKSEALPRVWQEWQQFQALADRTAKEAEKLNELSSNGADSRTLRTQFMSVGKTCRSCHTDYRKKKE